jgi:hypothetical protein
VIVEDASDPLNFNNLVISAKGATNPIVKKDTNVKLFTFLIIFLNMFELFVTKNIVPNFCEKKFPTYVRYLIVYWDIRLISAL